LVRNLESVRPCIGMTTVIDTNETLYARVLGDSSRVESSGLEGD
jgi:hypothetical protein